MTKTSSLALATELAMLDLVLVGDHLEGHVSKTVLFE